MSKDAPQPDFKSIKTSPRELMRARHPDLFSDTESDITYRLPKPVFEYHLDTLTNRGDEYVFEDLCRRIAEKEICPNLRPQTGPIGGGDSKVDAENLPVSDHVSQRTWYGSPSAGPDVWAFAFSAKKTWTSKARSDVQKIRKTQRPYTRIYFFTSHFAPDKKRAEIEDELRAETGIPVHIVDRNWLTDKIYNNGHLELAITALNIESAEAQRVRRPGPLDTERENELNAIDDEVTDPTRYGTARYQLVQDCLRSAILARNLERPRSEVESRFAHAESLAQPIGFRPQLLRVAYNRAWTAFWWHEDFTTFLNLYDVVEDRLQGSTDANEVELLCNLWQLLHPAVAHGHVSENAADIAARTDRLRTVIQPIADDASRPNNALQARTSLVLLEITEKAYYYSGDGLDSSWTKLSDIVDQATLLASYPIERIADLIRIFGDVFSDDRFDELYEKIVSLIGRRRDEGAAGQAYADRGRQMLNKDAPYKAIEWLGRAEELLLKEEYSGHLAWCLLLSSYAYERVGLLWASRNKILVAVDITMRHLRDEGDPSRPLLKSLQRLVWIELQIGRLPHVLSGLQLTDVVSGLLKTNDEEDSAFFDERRAQEMVLCAHWLNLPYEALPDTDHLPDGLHRLDLPNARSALLYALGYEEVLRTEGAFPQDHTPEQFFADFEEFMDRVNSDDIIGSPLLLVGEYARLRSNVLGCRLIIETSVGLSAFAIAESLLGVFEAFVSTSNEQDLCPHREALTIRIHESADTTQLQSEPFQSDEQGVLTVQVPSDLSLRNHTEILRLRDWLLSALSVLLPKIFIIRDVNTWLARVCKEERAFSRALVLSDMLTLDRNMFDGNHLPQLTDWYDEKDRAYRLNRTTHWAAEFPTTKESSDTRHGEPTSNDANHPEDRLGSSAIKHTDRRVIAPIDIELWDRAGWCATLFAQTPGEPPILALTFNDGEAGVSIFRQWRERWNCEDQDNELRVSIIRGISKHNPAEYAVVVGPAIPTLLQTDNRYITFISRINRMTPSTSTNLDRFLEQYDRYGTYLLCPASMNVDNPLPHIEYSLSRRRLHVRQAWEIGEHDEDLVALKHDDAPVIPESVEEPPVYSALSRLQAKQRPPGSD